MALAAPQMSLQHPRTESFQRCPSECFALQLDSGVGVGMRWGDAGPPSWASWVGSFPQRVPSGEPLPCSSQRRQHRACAGDSPAAPHTSRLGSRGAGVAGGGKGPGAGRKAPERTEKTPVAEPQQDGRGPRPRSWGDARGASMPVRSLQDAAVSNGRLRH